MKKTITSLVLSLLIFTTFSSVASAQSLENQLMKRIQELTQVVQQLQLQLVTPKSLDSTKTKLIDTLITKPTFNFTRNLYLGVKGEDVKELQSFLRSTGDFKYPEITGYYGAVTEDAVKKYQARNGIVSSGTAATTGYGVVGAVTRSYIIGSSGNDGILSQAPPSFGNSTIPPSVDDKYVIVGAGQSNMGRYFTLSNGQIARYFRKQIADNLGLPVGDVLFIKSAYGNTSADSRYSRPTSPSCQYWVNTNIEGNPFSDGPCLTATLKTIQDLINAGNTPDLILWAQGENDAVNIKTTKDKEIYESSIIYIFGRIREVVGEPNLKIGIQEIGKNNKNNPKGTEAVRDIQQRLDKDSNNQIKILATTKELPLADGVHLTAEGYKTASEIIAKNLKKWLDNKPLVWDDPFFYVDANPSPPVQDKPSRGGDKTTISIDTSASNYGKPVNTNLFGGNIVYSKESDTYWDDGSNYKKLFQFNNTFLRYPGGAVTSYFHWKDPVGLGWVDSWAPGYNGARASDGEFKNFDEYMTVVADVNLTPVVGINISSGDLYNRIAEGIQEARDFVAYAQEKYGGIKYWFIDNENYSPNSNAQMTAGKYAEYINMYVPEIKKVNPKIEAIANWNSVFWNSASTFNLKSDWKKLLTDAADNIDIIDVHTYWGSGLSWSDYVSSKDVEFYGVPYLQYLKELRKQLDNFGASDVELGLFEWGVRGDGGTALTSSQAAVIASDIMIQIINSQVVDFAAYWPIYWGQKSTDYRGIIDSDRNVTSVMKMLSMFSPLKNQRGGRIINSVAFNNDNLEVVASQRNQNKDLQLYILNKSDEVQNVELLLNNFSDASSFMIIGAASYKPKDDDLSNGELVWSKPVYTTTSTSISTKLPAWSLTRFEISPSKIEGLKTMGIK